MTHFLGPICLLIIVGAAIGCAPSAADEDRSPEETAFRSKCQTCHRLPDPNVKSDSEWMTWLEKHRSKAKLDSVQFEQITTWVTGANAE